MKITDEMLYRHAAEARDIWLDTLPDDSDIPEHEFSDEFNKEMDRLIGLSQKNKKTSSLLSETKSFSAVPLCVPTSCGPLIGLQQPLFRNGEYRSNLLGHAVQPTAPGPVSDFSCRILSAAGCSLWAASKPYISRSLRFSHISFFG